MNLSVEGIGKTMGIFPVSLFSLLPVAPHGIFTAPMVLPDFEPFAMAKRNPFDVVNSSILQMGR
jgi:hypothetical protein